MTQKETEKIIDELLKDRGITDENRERFLDPSYEEHLHDPFLMKDMEKAVRRILDAVQNNQRIVIYADYDADGVPGAVLFHDFFDLINYSNFEIFIPHRHLEGFGLKTEKMKEFSELDTNLIVTVDCGVTDTEPIKLAQDLGIDVIVTDHHEQPTVLPPAYAVVNPKREDCDYPYPFLCGAAVAYKVIQGLIELGSFDLKPGVEKWMLDMVGIATLSDMVPLQDENRVLAHYGLKVLRKSRRPGLRQLCYRLGLNQGMLSEDDIGFMISPRINAASRMGHSMDAFHLLVEKNQGRVEDLVKELERINRQRKGVVASIVKEVKHKLESREIGPVIVTGSPDWRPSLLGLAANSIAEEFSRPVFLWGRDGGDLLKGSCRSSGGINLIGLMDQAEGAFLEYGGHAYAGGFSVSYEGIHQLEEKLTKSYNDSKNILVEEVKHSGHLISISSVSQDLFHALQKIGPFGIANPKPIFRFEDVLVKNIRSFGKQGEHLEVTLENQGGGSVKAISFFNSVENLSAEPLVNQKINLLASLEKSYFRGQAELRLRLIDVF